MGDQPGAAPTTGATDVQPLEVLQRRRSRLQILKKIGPGLIAGASDDDPSAIGSYAIAGAAFGYTTLWMAIFTLPMMIVVQYICAKIGLVASTGLGTLLRQNYPKKVVYPVIFSLLIVNTITAGVDIGAIAAGVNLLIPIPPAIVIVAITLIVLVFEIWGSYKLLSRVFKWLTLALLAYVGAALFAHPQWGEVLRNTFIPTIRFDANFVAVIVALFGQSLTPFMFFWQVDEEAEAAKADKTRANRRGRSLWTRRRETTTELEYTFWDINVGMVFANLIMYFIILATGATLFQAGKTQIHSAAEAAQALTPLAGQAAGVLFAVGLIGAGFLAVPVLTASGAYAVSQVFKWRYGLDEKLHRARHFYAVIIAATILGMAINFLNINPIDSLFWVSVISGLLAPFLLVVIMLISNNKRIMGERVNSRLVNVLGWATTLILFVAVAAMLVVWLTGRGS